MSAMLFACEATIRTEVTRSLRLRMISAGGRLRLALWLLICLVLSVPPVQAQPRAMASGGSGGAGPTEWVLILDNSASMSVGSSLAINNVVSTLPPTDPDRLSVLATLIFRSLLAADDKLTILTFDSSAVGRYRELPATQVDIRGLQFNQSTPFTGPLKRARDILTQSRLPSRRLLLFTDGAPSSDDPLTPQQARALLGFDPLPAETMSAKTPSGSKQPFEVLSLGLSANLPQLKQMQQIFLSALGPVQSLGSPQEIITSFTSVLAEHMQSRPLTGRLQPGGSYSFPVGKYVSEVLVSMASEQRMPVFSAQLLDAGRPLPVKDEAGDNGCASQPCHTYRVMRTAHDPDTKGRLSLRLDQATGQVVFGIILRYDLMADIVAAPTMVRVGEEFEVVARMLWHGRTFQDADFFAGDGFSAQLELGSVHVPLERRSDGTFAARIKAADLGAQSLVARFSNQWLQLTASTALTVEGWLPLQLKATPNPLPFGTWTGDRVASRRCVTLSLAGSQNAERVALEAIGSDLPSGMKLVTTSPLVLKDNATELCLQVSGCCSDLLPGATTRILLRGQHPHYHPEGVALALDFSVGKTPFLTCWWRVIAAILGALFLAFVLVGFLSPHDFDAVEVIRLAKTESALQRTTGRRLSDLPGGKRGFYRHARIAFDSTGNSPQRLKDAAIIVRATASEPLIIVRNTVEHKDPRTHKWAALKAPLDPSALRRGVVYRSGDIYFRLG